MSMHFSRVFERDNRRCVYCGRDLMTDFETFMTAEEDHLVPRQKAGMAGLADADNLVTACAVCNRLKGAFDPTADTAYVPEKRLEYIQAIREYVMACRAKKMADFASWTHPAERKGR